MKRYFTVVPEERAAEIVEQAKRTALALQLGSGEEAVSAFNNWAEAARQLPGPWTSVDNYDFEQAVRRLVHIPMRQTSELLIPPACAGELARAMPKQSQDVFEVAHKSGLFLAQWFDEVKE